METLISEAKALPALAETFNLLKSIRQSIAQSNRFNAAAKQFLTNPTKYLLDLKEEKVHYLAKEIKADAEAYRTAIEEGQPFEITKEIYLKLKHHIQLSEVYIQHPADKEVY